MALDSLPLRGARNAKAEPNGKIASLNLRVQIDGAICHGEASQKHSRKTS